MSPILVLYQLTIEELLAFSHRPFDVVSIDVESLSTELFAAFARAYQGPPLRCANLHHLHANPGFMW